MPKKHGHHHHVDSLVIDDGDNILIGTHHSDTINSLGGDDTITGRNGKDNLDGGDDDDTLNGGNGKDVVAGGLGNDHLIGGNGKDVLDGGEGNDLLEGGRGKDLFKFVDNFGNDTIADFRPGHEHMDLTEANLAFADLKIEYTNGDALISSLVVGDTRTILLKDVDANSITESDFLFA